MDVSMDDASRGPNIVAVSIVMLVVSIVSVILRFWSRFLSQQGRFWWDDWAALMALVFFIF